MLTLGARIKYDVDIHDVDCLPHFSAEWTALELVDLDGFSGLLPVPSIPTLRHLSGERPSPPIHERDSSRTKSARRTTWQKKQQ